MLHVCFIGNSFVIRFRKYCSAHAIVNSGFDLDSISLFVMVQGGCVGFVQVVSGPHIYYT